MYRWRKAYLAGGLAGLARRSRSDRGDRRKPISPVVERFIRRLAVEQDNVAWITGEVRRAYPKEDIARARVRA